MLRCPIVKCARETDNITGVNETKIVCSNEQVQEQARERRRSDRKEKRELDKEKTTAENKARALEGEVWAYASAPLCLSFKSWPCYQGRRG